MTTFILSCEHASCELPKNYQSLYSSRYLHSHRGYDRGAFKVFQQLKSQFDVWGIAGQYSRLLIDLNRSLNNPQVFSNRSNLLSDKDKIQIVNDLYSPYRNAVLLKIKELLLQQAYVIHLSIHSFTPILKGDKRTNDLGLLFDPKRQLEQKLCTTLKKQFDSSSTLQVAFNQPYAGTDDGLTTTLRTEFSDAQYAGIEIEFNQNIFNNKGRYEEAVNIIRQFIQSYQKT